MCTYTESKSMLIFTTHCFHMCTYTESKSMLIITAQLVCLLQILCWGSRVWRRPPFCLLSMLFILYMYF